MTRIETRGEMIEYLVLLVKGMAYGITHIIPGLGGSLVLILLGVYERFVDAAGNLFVKRDHWKEYLRFLIPLGLGMVIGMVVLAKLIGFLMEDYAAPTQFFFMGLVIGTIRSVLLMCKGLKPTAGRVAALVVALAVVFAVRFLNPGASEGGDGADLSGLGGALYNLLASFLGGVASVTPGLDGSYMLMLMRTYNPVIAAVGGVMDALQAFDLGAISWAILITTGVGAVAGILLFSKVMDTILRRARGVAYYAILGLVAGSLYGLWPSSIPAGTSVLACFLTFVAGVAAAVLLSRVQPKAQPAA
jgi:putative membrane protein